MVPVVVSVLGCDQMVSSSNLQLSGFSQRVDSFSNTQLNQLTIDTPKIDGVDPLQTATGIYITVHGHFYQPPRENPYLDAIWVRLVTGSVNSFV